MKTKISAFAILLLAGASAAQAQSTAYATTTAVMVTPIAISKTTDMHFGTVASSGNAGTVALDYADGRTTTGGASLPAGKVTALVRPVLLLIYINIININFDWKKRFFNMFISHKI